MAFSSSHPADAWRPTDMNIADFQTAITDACRNYYGDSSRNRLYDKMRVLAVHWEADGSSGLCIGNLARRVRDLFQRSYGYAVELLSIRADDADPDATISHNLHRMLHDLKEDDLAIVYYIGHGDQATSPNGLQYLALTPTAFPGRPSQQINFQEVRTRLIDPCPANVLILLDCCSAAGAGIGNRKELIAASAFDGVTRGGPDGFTSILVQQLQHALDNRHIMSSAQLYNRMATQHLNPNTTQMPIMLAPNFAHEQWTPGPVNPLFQSPVSVVLHVHLRDANEATLSQIKNWLLVNRPHNVARVEIKAVIPSFSMIFIIRVTLDVWYSLRSHRAISFIGFEKNDHPAAQVLQQSQSNVSFAAPSKSSSAGDKKENQPLK
ncbi:hypothetical protein N0V84_012655 [Fusarium piperis]|uniref:Peptidase C14 caspase domain-containing protein n=1 Tax=Fusarium piperis TaxID=1435070 RepID=A0A9W8W2J7_9HYPO|nr:hypothetical protein N0V84_012655 [Fusarium piperis]